LLLNDLENHDIISSILPARRFLIVDLIEQGYLLVIGGLVIFQIFWSLLMVRPGGDVVDVSYVTSELRSRLDVAFNAIYGVHKPSMKL
jgi:hypothetical protein